MNARPLQSSTNVGREREPEKPTWPYRLVWACLPVTLVLSGVVLLLFGVSWWTAFVVVLLLGCPASMAVALYLGLRPFPRIPGPDRGA